MMKCQKPGSKGMLAAVIVLAAAPAVQASSDFTECLDALNTKTVVFKGRIQKISPDGQMFSILGAKDPKTGASQARIYTPSGIISVSTNGPVVCPLENGSSQIKSAAGAVLSAIGEAVIMMNDPTNSQANKDEVVRICSKNPEIKKLMETPGGGSDAPYPGTSQGDDKEVVNRLQPEGSRKAHVGQMEEDETPVLRIYKPKATHGNSKDLQPAAGPNGRDGVDGRDGVNGRDGSAE